MSDRTQHDIALLCTLTSFDCPDQPSSGRCRIHNEKYKGREREACLYSGKGKGKAKAIHPMTGHESLEGEYRYSSTLSLTSALDGVGG